MTRCSWLLMLFWLSLPAFGNSAIEMELTAGLGGQAVTDLSNEINIRLYATSTITGELQIVDANGSFNVPVTVNELSQKELWLTVTPGATGAVQVRLQTDTGQTIDKELRFDRNQMPITLITSQVPAYQTHNSRQQSTAIRPVVISASALPHRSQAYAGIFAVVSDAQSLSSLSNDQYRAFAEYLSACNILLLSAASSHVLESVRNLSGCRGNFIQSYESLDQVTPLLQKLDSRRPAKLPTSRNLVSLQQPEFQASMTNSIIGYLAGYIVFMALVNWCMNKTFYLLMLPLLTAAAGLLVWNGAGTTRLISWSEMQSGDSHIRTSSVLMLGGDRRGASKVTIDANSGLSGYRSDSMQSSITAVKEGSRRELKLATQLLSPHVYQLTNTDRQIPAFSLQLKQGLPELVFHAETAVDGARLLWQDHSYDVPVLAPGQSWFPHKSLERATASAEEKLLHRLLEFDAAALLMSFNSNRHEVVANDLQSSGWLVIRAEPAL